MDPTAAVLAFALAALTTWATIRWGSLRIRERSLAHIADQAAAALHTNANGFAAIIPIIEDLIRTEPHLEETLTVTRLDLIAGQQQMHTAADAIEHFAATIPGRTAR